MAMQEVAMQTDLTEAINVVIVKPQVKFSYTLYGTDAKWALSGHIRVPSDVARDPPRAHIRRLLMKQCCKYNTE